MMVKLTGSMVVLSISFLTIASSENEVYYCNSNSDPITIANQTTGTIRSVYEGQNFYDNNMHCVWVIDTGPGNNTVVWLSIENSHLSWAPPGAICQGYDYMDIIDGVEREVLPGEPAQDVFVSFCGENHPGRVISSGRYFTIRFNTNDRNQGSFAGVTLKFEVFETSHTLGACPPGFHDNPSLSDGGDDCFYISDHQQTWNKAQSYCTYQQSNLADLDDGVQADFVTDLASQQDGITQIEDIWLGLNDIEVDEQYTWINGSRNTGLYRWRGAHQADTYLNCVCYQHKDGLWKQDFCNEQDIQTAVKHYFVCKRKKVGPTKLYQIPRERIEKGNIKGLPVHIIGVIVGVILAVLVLALIVGLCCFCSKRRPSWTNKSRSSYTQSPRRESPSNAQSSRGRASSSHGSIEYGADGLPREPPPSYQQSMADSRL